MDEEIGHDILEDGLNRCGAHWDAAQTHGLLTGRLAVAGGAAGPEWLLQIFEGTDEENALRAECEKLLHTLYQSTYRQLSERLSDFRPLLPSDEDEIIVRTAGLAHWSEGFLHGLVSAKHGEALKNRLATEPLSDIIKDMLQITRAGGDEGSDVDDSESAYVELVEYLRVAAQLCFEELAEIRHDNMSSSESAAP